MNNSMPGVRPTLCSNHPGAAYRCEQTRIRLERDWLFTFVERQRAEA
jgi:hypothetical protein